jgi:hypothetical protein
MSDQPPSSLQSPQLAARPLKKSSLRRPLDFFARGPGSCKELFNFPVYHIQDLLTGGQAGDERAARSLMHTTCNAMQHAMQCLRIT